MEKSGISDYEILDDFKNDDFVDLELQHPFYDLTVPAITADHVILEQSKHLNNLLRYDMSFERRV